MATLKVTGLHGEELPGIPTPRLVQKGGGEAFFSPSEPGSRVEGVWYAREPGYESPDGTYREAGLAHRPRRGRVTVEHEITYLDGPYVAMITGTVSFIETTTCSLCGSVLFETDAALSEEHGATVWSHVDEGCDDPKPEVAEVVVETDGGAFFIPAARVITWRES